MKKLRDMNIRFLEELVETLDARFPVKLATPEHLGNEMGRMHLSAGAGQREVINAIREGIELAKKDAELDGTPGVPADVLTQAE